VIVPAKKRRSPQEKKSLSYSRDRRNCYGENDKGSRKDIARGKRRRHRAARRGQHQLLGAALGTVDEDTQGLVGERLVTTAPSRASWWRKAPDEQLGHHVARALQRRVDLGVSAAQTERARIAKVLRNTAPDQATAYSIPVPRER
jgi:hypothetical protein